MKLGLLYEAQEMMPIYRAVIAMWHNEGSDLWRTATKEQIIDKLLEKLEGRSSPEDVRALVERHWV